MARAREHLVDQHVERIGRPLLEKHPAVLREYVKGKRGVYALYKGPRLYYVGLASNLRSRLKQHLRDRHASAWDSFSMYLTTRAEHLRELEALVLRITMPRGNKSKTKFAKSTDLRKSFRRSMDASHNSHMDEMFGARKSVAPEVRARRRTKGEPTLLAFISGPLKLRFVYKGKVHKAAVRATGVVIYRKQTFNSPSLAGRAVTGRPTNGWNAWKYLTPGGTWAQLDQLRHR